MRRAGGWKQSSLKSKGLKRGGDMVKCGQTIGILI